MNVIPNVIATSLPLSEITIVMQLPFSDIVIYTAVSSTYGRPASTSLKLSLSTQMNITSTLIWWINMRWTLFFPLSLIFQFL